ncbi:hypothetical protein PR048_022500 [Dryococelus australis]|uniref:ATP-dependent DNA helicase n=1 Tax=Dryococelus australis TaxID=614101 RepID=A0ABQ9H197_9NEOP|nr:hypothetical protein PR048_022500 [Dryococelus australis]
MKFPTDSLVNAQPKPPGAKEWKFRDEDGNGMKGKINKDIKKCSVYRERPIQINTVVKMDDAGYYPAESISNLYPPRSSPLKLLLMFGTPAILLRNLKLPKRCNSTRLQGPRLSSGQTSRTGFHSWSSRSRIFACADCIITMSLVSGFYRGSPVCTSLSFRLVIILGAYECGSVVTRLLAFHFGQPCPVHGGVAPRFSHLGIVPDIATGRRVFSGISHFPANALQRAPRVDGWEGIRTRNLGEVILGRWNVRRHPW